MTPTNNAWNDGFKSGKADYHLGIRSLYASTSFETESDYVKEYVRGYNAGWNMGASWTMQNTGPNVAAWLRRVH